jgi:aminoglycoside phosphotransferase (APT) family kinase protein
MARSTIQSQFPELDPVRIEWLGAGWDNDLYLASGEWIFRFPRRREVATSLHREICSMPVVREALSDSTLQIPIFEKLGRPGEFFPYPFVGYRMLPGVSGDSIPRDRLVLDALARELGFAFSSLHGIADDRVAHLGLPIEDHGPSQRVRRLVEGASQIRPVLPGGLADRCEAWLCGRVDVPGGYSGPPRVIHDDICPDHILVDEETGLPTALIDFGDLSLGDPALDFVGLYCWLGRSFIDTLLAYYPLPLDEGFHERLRFVARVMSLCWLGDASLEGRPDRIPKHQDWVRTAFDRANA